VVVIAQNENHGVRNQQIELLDSRLASLVQRLQPEKVKAVEVRDHRAWLRSFRTSRPGKKQLAVLRFARPPKNTPDALKIVVDVTVAEDLRVAVINWTKPMLVSPTQRHPLSHPLGLPPMAWT